MGWVRIDDSFFSHPKVLAAGDRAIGLWVRALAYANAYLTDGHISRETLRALGATRREAGALVACGLWEANGNGWEIHDFAEYQDSREQIEAGRAAARERMAKRRRNGKGKFG